MFVNKLPVFVVSLKNSDRRETMSAKLEGFDYEFFDAVYGKNFLEDVNSVNTTKWINKRYKRSITPGEYGCSMSHRKIYEKMVKENISWAIILEDDVDFDFDFQSEINESINHFDENNLYILGCQEGLSSAEHIIFSRKTNIKYKRIFLRKTIKSHRYIYRTAAYMISRKTASKILDFTDENFCLADDWFIFSKYKLFNNIYLGSFINHPVVLDGQSTIENERLLNSNKNLLKGTKLFNILRNLKILFRQYVVRIILDK